MIRPHPRYLFVSAFSLFVAFATSPQINAVEISHLPSNDQDKQNQPRVISLVVHPAAESSLPMRYPLLPPLADRHSGNAAIRYHRAIEELPTIEEDTKKVSDWLEMPLEKMPVKEVAKMLQSSWVLREMEGGARCSSCDWELPLDESGTSMYEVVLPEVQAARSLGRFIALKCRLQIAQGHYEEAVHSLQTGFALARHVAQGPTLINDLVGIAICAMMTDRVNELCSRRDAPNLYWSLSALPRPMIDLRPGFESELHFIHDGQGLKSLRNLQLDRNDTDYWRTIISQVVAELNLVTPNQQGLSAALFYISLTPKLADAKAAMTRRGYTAEQVKEMPMEKILLLGSLQTTNEIVDQTAKWISLPYLEAHDGMAAAQSHFATEGRKREIIPIAGLLMPAFSSALRAPARCDRQIALLRLTEALRIYAAGHGGKLPQSLDGVKEVPIPTDPVTGKAFPYETHGDRATIAPITPADWGKTQGVRVELQMIP